MKGLKYIKEKQKLWARRKGIALCGSKKTKGDKIYTTTLNSNLYMELHERHKDEFLTGDGNELSSSAKSMAKMNALHSSSATAVNFFHYWSSNNKLDEIAHACNLCNKGKSISKKIFFEKKFNILGKSYFSPNIDVVIENNESFRYKVFAIECKFTEPFSGKWVSGKNGQTELFPKKYLINSKLWVKIPNTYELAKKIFNSTVQYHYLDAAQLIKHILGLTKEYSKSKFRLLYLWYDVLGKESYKHSQELEDFINIVSEDNITISSNTYQEIIIKLSKYYYQCNKDYIDYLSGRYL